MCQDTKICRSYKKSCDTINLKHPEYCFKITLKAWVSRTSLCLLDFFVKLRCFMGIHKLAYSPVDKTINDWAICRDCLNEYKIFNRGRWYQTKYFIK